MELSMKSIEFHELTNNNISSRFFQFVFFFVYLFRLFADACIEIHIDESNKFISYSTFVDKCNFYCYMK